ncbi:proclotting enzyme-like [Anopheles aquasalis]|uniref:proclotting enzyme-like n=1 Tax=Anopheles aquasalis TaxID=42839 RepID=UPI00215AE9F4|nr:proclotting enzyme-like [Anopheles aquasalis]
MASGRFQFIAIVAVLFAIASVVSAQGDAPKKKVEFQKCRNDAGVCMAKDECSVPTFRLRRDGCPSDLDCCPKATVPVTDFVTVNSTEKPAITNTESESEEIVEWSTDDIPTEIVTKTPKQIPPPTPKVEDSRKPISEYNKTHVFTTTTTNTKPTYATTHPTKPHEAQRSDHNAPWLATIFDGNRRHCCHGALISNRFVLTASTCWTKCKNQPNLWTVRLGLRHSNSSNSSIDVKVQNGLQHDRFKNKNRANNIAVLQLNQTISFSQHINSISPPTEQESIAIIDRNLLYTGWNGSFAQTSASNEQPDMLKMIELKQINGTYCRSTILANQKGTILPNDKYFCVMSNNASETCDPNSSRCIVEDHQLLFAGHAGGPVVARMPDNRYVLYGIISRCYDNNKAHVPTLVTNVFDYKSWINGIVSLTKNNKSNG